MPQLIIVYWRDIPAQVIVKQGRKNAKRPLEERFEKAIDAAAMRDGASETDDYLAEWRKADPIEITAESLDAAAEKAVADLHAAYDTERLRSLIANGGRNTAAD